MVRNIFANEWVVAVAIFFVAFLVRVPYVWNPPEVMFDEGLYATFTMATDRGRPFFDIHPPLPKLIYTSFIHGVPYTYRTITDVGTSYDDFPYLRLRLFHVVVGSLLPVAVYFLSRALFDRRLYGFFSATLVLVDPAFILYARSFLPDTLLLFAGIAGMAFIAWGEKKQSILLFLFGAFMLASTCSMKLTGLGFLGAGILYLLTERRFLKAFFVALLAPVLYVAIFSVFFYRFTPGVMHVSEDNEQYLHGVYFPEKRLSDVVAFTWTYSKLQYFSNRDYQEHKFASSVYQWPFGDGAFAFWNRDGRIIRLMSNPISWSLGAIVVVCGTLGFFISRVAGMRVLSRRAGVLLGAYWGNALPFLLVPRGMFLYHYFPALLFALLLIPVVIVESGWLPKEYERRFFGGIACAAGVVSSILLILFVYKM